MLDHVVRIVNIQFPEYHTENVGYSSHPDFTSSLPESANFCIQIIGGSLSLHWRTIFFEKKDNEESVISVYDSLNCSTDEGLLLKSLCDFELKYIQKRFPKIEEQNIFFKKMKVAQPDTHSCGVYSVAFLTTLLFGGDPSSVNYANVKNLRKHFYNILTTDEILPFPNKK